MTTFLNNENESSSSEDENEQDVPINFGEINIPRVIDREDDVLEQAEEHVLVVKAAPEPFNLDELNISIPNLKYDTDEFYLEVLREKYGAQVVERGCVICREYDCYLQDT